MMVDFAPYGGPEGVGPSGLPLTAGESAAAAASSRKSSDVDGGGKASDDASSSKLDDSDSKEVPGVKLGGSTPVGLTPRELRLSYYAVSGWLWHRP